MDLGLSEELRAVADLAVRLGGDLRRVHRETEKHGLGDIQAAHQAASLRELDWPEAAGGHGLGTRAKVVVLEALANGDATAALALERAAWVGSPMLRVDALAKHIQDDLQDPGFTPVCFVDQDGALTLEEGQISGEIPYVPAQSPDLVVVMMGDTLHLIRSPKAEPVAPGALHGAGASRIVLDRTPVSASVSLDAQTARRIRGGWRLFLAALLVGLSEAAAKQTREFCLDRVTFGKKVAHHQAVAFLLSDMEIAVRAARVAVADAADRVDQGGGSCTANGAFLQAVQCALLCTDLGVQLHGAHGYVEDYPVEKWMREARALSLLCGGVDGARMDAGQVLEARMSGGMP